MKRLMPSVRPVVLFALQTFAVAALLLRGQVLPAADAAAPQPAAAAVPPAFNPANSSAFFKAYCVACHGATKPEGYFNNLNIEPLLAGGKLAESVTTWQAVLERLEARDMPPDDGKSVRPGEEDFEKSSAWLRHELVRFTPPRGHWSRRLNRLEYNNTIRDLLRIDYGAADEFPPDLGLEGFDNIVEAQSLAPNLLEKYAQAAQDSLERAIFSGERPPLIDIHYYPITREQWEKKAPLKPSPIDLEQVIGRHEVAFDYGGAKTGDVRFLVAGGTQREGKGPHGYETVIEHRQHPEKRGAQIHFEWPSPVLGARYKVKVKAYAEPNQDKQGREIPPSGPCILGFFANHRSIARVAVELGTEPKEYEFEFVANSRHHVSLRMNAQAEANGRDTQGVPRLIICEAELIGPFLDSWPPPSHQAIFGPDNSWKTAEILAHFIERAFRRPASADEIATYCSLIDAETAVGTSQQDAILLALQAILVSPNFLFLVEQSRPDGSLSDYELATRLSYFLWSSMPDAELFRLAGEGKLHDPATLREQVTRMLADPKAEALVDGFAVQWLGIRRANDLTPDSKLFPTWDNDLRRAMQEESESFFRYVMRENLSLLSFLDADFCFVNQRLAKHYGLDGVTGLELRKFDLKPEDGRGGVLTQGLVLAVGAQPTRTSPVNRGKFVVDKLFNRPPPNPPADVPKLEENPAGKSPQTLREQLAQHARQTQCAACHQKIDYWGLALEGYDAIGGRRKVTAVDESASLPDGRAVVGAAGLKQELLRRKADFIRGLSEKMMLYALGRTLTFEDKEQIPAIGQQVAADEYRFHTLVKAIVLSDAFRKH